MKSKKASRTNWMSFCAYHLCAVYSNSSLICYLSVWFYMTSLVLCLQMSMQMQIRYSASCFKSTEFSSCTSSSPLRNTMSFSLTNSFCANAPPIWPKPLVFDILIESLLYCLDLFAYKYCSSFCPLVSPNALTLTC